MIILAVVGVVVLVVVGATLFLSLHRAPSCSDGKQNQDESGIDCGGSCQYLCLADTPAPTVTFARTLTNAAGRTDIIAQIKNPNVSAAAQNVRYTVELYDADRAVIAKKDGVLDLPPASLVPIFIPNMFSGEQTIDRAFVSIDASSLEWFSMPEAPRAPNISDARITGTLDAPRIQAAITNPYPTSLKGMKFIATVFNQAGNAIGASQTVIPALAAQQRVDIVFAWTMPFPDAVARIEVAPLLEVSP